MQRFVDWVKRNLSVVLAVAALLVLVVLVIGLLPSWLTRHPSLPKSVDRHKAISDTRSGLVAFLVALGAAGGLAYTARTYRLTRTGQITDRYAKAIELLGSDTRDVRIGGIFALERIMDDSEKDQPTIVEVLAAFIRDHAPRPKSSASGTNGRTIRRAADVQAALTVLGRRTPVPDERPFDLARTGLRGAWLAGANLTGAVLAGADLSGAELLRANLTGAVLGRADLSGAVLGGANLTGAVLGGANLTGAWLNGANLTGAELDVANLNGASLGGADLSGAWLNGADLSGAKLRRSQLTDEQLDSAQGVDGIDWQD